jgi:N-acetylmuramoyl-L-alanine amidase
MMNKKVLRFLSVFMAMIMMGTTWIPQNVYAGSITQQDEGTSIQPEENVVSENNTVSQNSQEEFDEEFSEEEKLNYLYLESDYIESPGGQNVLIGYGNEETIITDGKLTLRNYRTQEVEIYSAEETLDNTVLFHMDFSSEQAGIYEIIGVNITTGEGVEQYIDFSDTGMDKVYFGVDEEIVETEETIADDLSVEMQIVNLDADGTAGEAAEEISAALEDADNGTVQLADELSAVTQKVGRGSNGEIVVVIDPGHDATHAGARANGLKEEELTLKIAQYCKAELEQYSGVTVYMTRNSSSCPYSGTSSVDDNKKRVEYAQSVGADAYVSIHLNSSTSTSAKGAQVFYPNGNYNSSIGTAGSNLATQVLRQVVALGLTNRGISIRNSEDKTLYPDGSLADYYGVIKNSKLAGFPGIIIEHAFLTNSSDAAFLSSEDNLKKLGVADATGVANYFGLSKVPVSATSVWVSSYKNEQYKGSFVVQIDGVTPLSAVKSIKVAAFTQSDGSDVAWYDAIYYGNGTYAITIDSDYHQRNSGFYIAQAYAELNDGSLYQLGTTYCTLTFQKPAVPSKATIGISNVNSTTGTFDVTIKNIVAEGGISKVRLGVYTLYGDDGAYYEAVKQADGTYKATVYIQNHKSRYGTYYVDAYVDDQWGQTGRVSSTSVDLARPKATISTSWNNGVESITAKNLGLDASVSGVIFAVWSDANGRDDLQCYTASRTAANTWTAAVPLKNHKTVGNYTIQMGIIDAAGTLSWAQTASFKVENGPTKKGNVTPANVDSEDGSFDVIIDGLEAKAGIANVQLAVWCDGDDFYGYSTFAYNGCYLAHIDSANHKYHYGKYVIRVIVTDNNGIEEIVTTKTVNLPEPTAFLGITSGEEQTRFGLVASNLGNPKNINSVVFAVWSEENGRDDLFLYQAFSMGNGIYISNAEIKNHKSYGKYDVQVGVIYKDGSIQWKCQQNFTVDKPTATKMEFGSFYDVENIFYSRIYGVKVPTGVESVAAMIWSKDDQSDLYCYPMALQSDGSYLLMGTTANHNYNSGIYKIQIYVTDKNGVQTLLGMSTANLTSVDTTLYAIMGKGSTTVSQMMNYYNAKATYPSFYASSDAPTLQDFCQIYYEECTMEGINVEVAFIQAMKETNFLKYTGDVKIEQYNFAGIGATGNGAAGNSFGNVRTGVRAQIQHLKAYATSEALVNPCVDPRYQYVKKGSAPYVEWLGIQENPTGAGWATAKNYGYSIVNMIKTLKTY